MDGFSPGSGHKVNGRKSLGKADFSERIIFFQEIVDKAANFSHCAFRRGAVAQLGERLNGIQEAVSSILSSSTR